VDFDLSPELAALQSTVRRLARDKVKHRAREIDVSGAYPTDIFEAFRDAGLLGLRLEVGRNAERLPHSVGLDARALGVADGTHRVAAKQ